MVRAITIRRFAASLVVILSFAAFLCAPSPGFAAPILGSELASFAILGGGGVMVNGTGSAITGSVGGYPTTAVTGYPAAFTDSGGTVYTTPTPSDLAFELLAHNELGTAITALSALAVNATVSTLGAGGPGQTLAPGVYSASSTLNLTGTLNLDGGANPDALWVFLVGSSLTTASNSVVNVTNTGAGAGVYWVMGAGSATLGSSSTFAGNILANSAITVGTGVTDSCGRLLTSVANVTLAGSDTIGIGCSSNGFSGSGLAIDTSGNVVDTTTGKVVAPVPEPSTLLLLATGLIGVAARVRRAKPR